MLFKKAILRKPKDCFFLSARRLCFPDKFCPANRAGNLDFSFAARDAQFIFAFGAFYNTDDPYHAIVRPW